MRRPLVRSCAIMPGFIQRAYLSSQRFADSIQALDLLLLLVDRFVQSFDLVFLEAQLGFEVVQAFFTHASLLVVSRRAAILARQRDAFRVTSFA